MQKKIIIYSPFAVWQPHFETDLELARKYINEGYKVVIISCRGDLSSCAPNPYHYFEKCWRCTSRFKSGISWLNSDQIDVVGLDNLTPGQATQVKEISNRTVQSADELRKIQIEGVDIGLSTLSSLISILREPSPDIASNLKLVRDNLGTALLVYYSVLNHLKDIKPECIIILNGRFSALRPAMRAAQRLKIDSFIHERGGVSGRYSLFKNTYVHDLDYWKSDIDRVWNSSKNSAQEKLDLADEWYKERIKGIPQGYKSFDKGKVQGKLPGNFNSDKVNLVIFISSEDEFAAIERWDNPLYENQNEGIEKILNDLDGDDRFDVYIRIHPNLSRIRNSQIKRLMKISEEYPRAIIIGPDDPISSYTLIKHCTLVISFGSTVGIEALYFKKPSILIARSFYEDLGGCIKPASHEDLMHILRSYAESRQLPDVGSSQNTISKYAYYMRFKGEPFRYAREYSYKKIVMLDNDREYAVRANIFVYYTAYAILGVRLVFNLLSSIIARKKRQA